MNKLKKRILSLITAAAVAFASVALPNLPGLVVLANAEGVIEGLTYNDGYYAIGTLDELKAFIAYANSVSDTTQCKGMTFKLTADIGSDEVPVGVISPVLKFDGAFDGAGHTITGAVLNTGSIINSDEINVGLFCSCYNNSTIQNLTLKNLTIDATDFAAENDKRPNGIGGICGWGNCSISDCHVTGSIKGHSYVGGIMGSGGSTTATINGCSFSGDITSTGDAFGGIIGMSSCPISDCTVTDTVLYGRKYAGGIAAFMTNSSSSEVSNCTVANISITTTKTDENTKKVTGAIIGQYGLSSVNEANIHDCTYECVNGELRAVGLCKVGGAETTNYDGGSTRRYTVHCGDYVTASNTSGTTYDVGGVTCYDSGAAFTLSHTVPVGSTFRNYVVKDGMGNDITDTVLHDDTLTMPENTSIVVTAEYDDAGGICGAKGSEDSVTWTLTKNGGAVTVDGAEQDALTLAITGAGAMADFEYSYGSTTAPWYAQKNYITTVTIGSGVTSIGEYAFYDCNNLKTLDLGGVTTIGGYAFGNCSLASLDLGNVTTIGDGAFSCCYMEELDLGGVTTIGRCAFEYCTSLSRLDLGSVVSIGSGAFYGCEKLEGQSITIPASVTSIDGNPFGLCGLTSLGVAEGNTAYRIDENGFLLSSDGKTLLFCPAGKTGPLTVPAGVETVCDDAFNGCTGLTGPVTIPVGVETIGNNAFNGCTGLTGSVTVPDSVTSIGNDAFYRCANIESIAVGSGIKAIGLYAFNNCSALKDIRIEGDSTDSSIEFSGGLFSGCNSLETVTLGDSVTKIGGGAFIGCSSIKSIFVSRNTEITGGAFSGINNGKVYYYGGKTYNIGSWSMNPGNAKPYRILTVADSVANGTVTASGTTTPENLAEKNCFLPGDTVTLTLTPDDGYSVDSVTCNGETLTAADGVYSFTMPGDADVTVSAKWTRVPSLTNGKVTAPKGAVLIVAEYDGNGKMTSVRSVSAPEGGWIGVPIADIASGAGFTLPDTYKLFLVNGETYAPLCAAWSN